MNQAALMRIMQTNGSLHDDVGGLLHRQRAFGTDESPQIGAGHILRHQVMHIAVLSRVIGADEIRVIELGLRSNLAFEIFNRLVRRLMNRQHFDGTFAAHHIVNRFEDLSHAALADEIRDDIRPQIEFVFPGQHLVGLIRRDNFHFDQLVGQSLISNFRHSHRPVSTAAHGSRRDVELLLGHQTAQQRGVSEYELRLVRHRFTTPKTREIRRRKRTARRFDYRHPRPSAKQSAASFILIAQIFAADRSPSNNSESRNVTCSP